MRGLAMTTEPETGSVTMLRKPGTPQTEPAATTPPAATPQATPTTAPLPEPGNTATRSKALRAGLVLVAAAGIGASIAYVASSRSPAPHAPLHAQMAGANGAAVNSSGITPPDLGTPPASPAKQATAPAASAQTAAPTNTDKPPVPASTPLTQPSPSLDAPAQATSEKTMPGTQADQPAPTPTTTAEDQLFMEMSRKLTEMASRIDTLEQKFDASQRALHDQLVSGLGTVGGRLDELRHREDTLEATQSVHAASPPAAAASVAVSAPAAAAPTPARNNAHKSAETAATHHTPSDAQPAEHPAPRPHYTVQAGAPDIAILESPLGQPVRVQPGSVLDGWGTVTAVTQSGSSWVVHTEHGTIR